MPKYSETHHLNIDDAGLASVHVAVHLQDADPRIARLLVLRVLDTASTIAYLDPLILPQTSGPCVHYDERSEHAADAYPCTYPYGDEHSDGVPAPRQPGHPLPRQGRLLRDVRGCSDAGCLRGRAG
jgi:hypothetical protein